MHPDTQQLVEMALAEDDAFNDQSGLLSVASNWQTQAEIILKEPGVIFGFQLAEIACELIDQNLIFTPQVTEGERLEAGSVIALLEGSGRSILALERTMMNLLGRMSGVASCTREYVDQTVNTKTRILDTRKTTPLWRKWERGAVRAGGGHNHRDTLASMIMLKENHIRCGGGLEAAVRNTQKALGGEIFEVETTCLDEFKRVLDCQVPRIMLDHFSTSQIRQAVQLRDDSSSLAVLEASGNMTLDRIAEVAETGVDEISVGALTHSARTLDLSLLVRF
jgi:nicotinate-nucleotide pyrophosphorylase (carboxylating)